MDKTLVFGLPKNSKVVSIVRTDTCMYDTCMTPLRQKPRPAEAFEAPGKPFAWHRSENEMHPSQLGVRQNSSGTALILTFSPREKEQQAHGSGFANEHPANPVACFCGATADDSPSPGGEGRGEVEPQRILNHTLFSQNGNTVLALGRIPTQVSVLTF